MDKLSKYAALHGTKVYKRLEKNERLRNNLSQSAKDLNKLPEIQGYP